jgi:hypothetical protein
MAHPANILILFMILSPNVAEAVLPAVEPKSFLLIGGLVGLLDSTCAEPNGDSCRWQLAWGRNVLHVLNMLLDGSTGAPAYLELRNPLGATDINRDPTDGGYIDLPLSAAFASMDDYCSAVV